VRDVAERQRLVCVDVFQSAPYASCFLRLPAFFHTLPLSSHCLRSKLYISQPLQPPLTQPSSYNGPTEQQQSGYYSPDTHDPHAVHSRGRAAPDESIPAVSVPAVPAARPGSSAFQRREEVPRCRCRLDNRLITSHYVPVSLSPNSYVRYCVHVQS
jgi:hypothetical protein